MSASVLVPYRDDRQWLNYITGYGYGLGVGFLFYEEMSCRDPNQSPCNEHIFCVVPLGVWASGFGILF